MLKYSLLFLLALTACGGKKKSDGANDALAKMTDYKTRLCACKDAACAAPLIEEFMGWATKFGGDAKAQEGITPEQEKQLDALFKQAMTCASTYVKPPADKAAPPAAKAAPPPGDKAAAPAPAAMDDVPPEVVLNFKRIKRNLTTYYITENAFPKIKAASLPAADCCKTGGKCAPEKEAFEKDQAWATLDFNVTEPNQFHYTYESDGTTFHAEATGDTDCDGKSQTYRLEGHAENGNVVAAITGP